MNVEDFLRQVSAQAKADNPVPLTKLGYIDYDFDMSTYPQVLPRVQMDGQPLSERGYQCLDSYTPSPGDRVILLPHGISYVILGSVERNDHFLLDPGMLMCSIDNHTATAQSFSGATYVNWDNGNPFVYDPHAFWTPSTVSRVTPTIPGIYKVCASVGFPTSAAGNRVIEIHLNGAAFRAAKAGAADMNNTEVRVSVTVPMIFNGTTDYLQVRAFLEGSSTSYNGNFPSGGDASIVSLYYVGPKRLTPEREKP